ncbi:discoidin domain-containing protein [Parabacteroides sp. OttesenSCG-928-G06]|nr:discoidin domain-containing protein [Parabacteroides sp. OttesenSCG-928-G06]
MKRVSILLSMILLSFVMIAQNDVKKEQSGQVIKIPAKLLDAKSLNQTWLPEFALSPDPVKSDDDHWAESGPNPYLIVDLGKSYMIEEFRQLDSKAQRPKFPNVSKYNIYVAEEMPKSGIKDIKWVSVVNATGREEENIKIDKLDTPVKARYVKYEAILDAKETIRLYRFEVYGTEYVAKLDPEAKKTWLWVGLIVVVLLAGGAFFFFKRKEFRL